MINAANSVGGWNPNNDDTGTDCDNAYDQEPEAYDKALGTVSVGPHLREGFAVGPPPAPEAMPTGVAGTPMPLPSAPANSAAPAAFSRPGREQHQLLGYRHRQSGLRLLVDYTANPDLSKTGLGSAEYVASSLAVK